jgi:hypothetical protein
MINGGASQTPEGMNAKTSPSGASDVRQQGSNHVVCQGPSSLVCSGVSLCESRTLDNGQGAGLNDHRTDGIIGNYVPSAEDPVSSNVFAVAEEVPHMYNYSWNSFSPADGLNEAIMPAFDDLPQQCQQVSYCSSFSNTTGGKLCQQQFAQQGSLEADLQSIDTAVEQLLAQKQLLLERRAAPAQAFVGNAATSADPVIPNLVFPQQAAMLEPMGGSSIGSSTLLYGGMSGRQFNKQCAQSANLTGGLAGFNRLSLLSPAASLSVAPSSASTTCGSTHLAGGLLQFLELDQPPPITAASNSPAELLSPMLPGMFSPDVQMLQDLNLAAQSKLLEYIEMCQLEVTLQNELLQLMPSETVA